MVFFFWLKVFVLCVCREQMIECCSVISNKGGRRRERNNHTLFPKVLHLEKERERHTQTDTIRQMERQKAGKWSEIQRQEP